MSRKSHIMDPIMLWIFCIGCSRSWGLPEAGTSGSCPGAGRTGSCQPSPSAAICALQAGHLRCQSTGQGWVSRIHGLLTHKCDRGVSTILVFHLFHRHWYYMLFFVILHACRVLQEKAMKNYSPGHECFSLKRQLYWNKSWQMRWYSNHPCWGCQECHWGHY